MPSEVFLGQELWRKLIEAEGRDAPAPRVLHALLRTYLTADPQYIAAYDLEKVVDKLGYKRQAIWKDLVDLFCFRQQILELNFRLLDGDEHYEVSFEMLQTIIAGDSVTLGRVTYPSEVAQRHIFPYFVPTKQFHLLLVAERAANA